MTVRESDVWVGADEVLACLGMDLVAGGSWGRFVRWANDVGYVAGFRTSVRASGVWLPAGMTAAAVAAEYRAARRSR